MPAEITDADMAAANRIMGSTETYRHGMRGAIAQALADQREDQCEGRTVLENYQDDPRYPIIWTLQESTERGVGLDVLSIPCISKEIAFAEADRRAGRMLDIGKAEGIDQRWQDYGNLPRGRDYVRQVRADLWQHVRVSFVVVEPGR